MLTKQKVGANWESHSHYISNHSTRKNSLFQKGQANWDGGSTDYFCEVEFPISNITIADRLVTLWCWLDDDGKYILLCIYDQTLAHFKGLFSSEYDSVT